MNKTTRLHPALPTQPSVGPAIESLAAAAAETDGPKGVPAGGAEVVPADGPEVMPADGAKVMPTDGPVLVEVSGLTITGPGGKPILDDVSLRVHRGERVCVVGESGSGKTTLALALLGALRPGLTVTAGRIEVDGQDVLSLRGAALRRHRRRVVSYLPQDPATALTATLRVRGQLTELSATPSAEEVARRLAEVALPADAAFQRRFPHQLSGGQQQRLALARSTSAMPGLLVFDEPTTGLDAHAQRAVMQQIDGLTDARDLALLLITHDLSVAGTADRLVVMHQGRIVEQGPLPGTLKNPSAAYTRELIRATPTPTLTPTPTPEAATATTTEPATDPGTAPAPSAPLLRVTELGAAHGRGRGRREVVSGISFDVHRGESVALLGISGSGKSTIARCLTGAHVPSAGTVSLDGDVLPAALRARSPELRRRIQLVPQDSSGSLNPRRTVGSTLLRPLRHLLGLDAEAADGRMRELLTQVELDPALAARYPRELSGGQRQRVSIARALSAGPDVLICDEMTSSLDVRVQAAILDLLAGLRRELGLGVVLITHDLGVLASAADRTVVLHEGLTCEQGPVGEVLSAPRHPWTRSLLAAAAEARGERPEPTVAAR
ncbi:ABC transporter ATP-binding protein [Streptomyces sp. KLOTTS4A1]|uniref:ABC transporter ATP-binding protein n=1 Tax=Streptomyces sp. KLOTTS4A1 TaxID=3390996 RepID=UPI0039F515E2